jgi:hypothetical protein
VAKTTSTGLATVELLNYSVHELIVELHVKHDQGPTRHQAISCGSGYVGPTNVEADERIDYRPKAVDRSETAPAPGMHAERSDIVPVRPTGQAVAVITNSYSRTYAG